ncbi:MAG: MFS transporter [Actinoplanes sp.]
MRKWLPPVGRNAWLALGMNTLSCLGSGLTMPFLLVYLHSIRGIPLPTAGLILATIGVTGLVVIPLTGPLVDRVGAPRAFIGGLAIGGVGIALFAPATTTTAAFAAAVVYGCSGGLTWNSFATLLSELVPADERGAVFALRYTSANAAFGAGALIAGLVTVGSHPGPYVAILLVDAASYVLFAAAMLLVRVAPAGAGPPGRAPADTRAGPPGRAPADAKAGPPGRTPAGAGPPGLGSGGYRVVLRDRALLGALLVNALVTVFALAQTSSVFAAWVTGPGESSSRVAGLAFALNIVVLLVVQLPVLSWARGRSRLGVAALSTLFFAAAWLVLAAGAGNTALIIGALGIFALGEALLSPTLPALVNDLAPDELRGRYNAVFALSQQAGPVLAPILGGLALGHGLGLPYLLGLTACCLAAGGVALRLRRSTPRAADLGLQPAQADAASSG